MLSWKPSKRLIFWQLDMNRLLNPMHCLVHVDLLHTRNPFHLKEIAKNISKVLQRKESSVLLVPQKVITSIMMSVHCTGWYHSITYGILLVFICLHNLPWLIDEVPVCILVGLLDASACHQLAAINCRKLHEPYMKTSTIMSNKKKWEVWSKSLKPVNLCKISTECFETSC